MNPFHGAFWRRLLRRARPGACDACGDAAGAKGGAVCAACLAVAERVAAEEASLHGGDAEYPTLQGVRVRSEGEAAIADHLFKHGVLFQYEPLVGRYRPDFLVPNERVIVEYYGMKSKDYNRRRAKKEAYYAEQGYRVIPVRRNDVPRLTDLLHGLGEAPPGLRAELKRQKKLAEE